MFIEKIELHGFKSFVNRTEVPLSPGITAIVGPNGCGKSNISDAFRWVLGESNVRNIRGERVQDVIFKGSRRAKPMGMAEVSLTMNNDDGTLPVEYAHVAVARRIFRSGDTEFAINKVPCRLKDLRDLFSGTGMGSHGYAVIERAMVDEVLSEKDDARRFLFEEAAGIVRYKQRRREAQRKLEGVEQDLTRIEDMIREIEREVRSLARQAGRVRRYRRIKSELDQIELRQALEQWTVLRDRSQSTELLHKERAGRKADLGSRISVLEAQHETERQRLMDVGQRVEAGQREVHEAQRELSTAHEEMRVLTTRNEAWSHEEADLRRRLERDTQRLTQMEEERAGLAPRMELLTVQLSEVRARAEEAMRARAEAENALRDVRAQLQSAQQTSMHLVTNFSEAQRDLKSQRTRREELVERRDGLLRHLEVFDDREKKVEGELSVVGETLAELTHRIAARVDERSQVVAELDDIRERREQLAREGSEQGHIKARVESRLAVLQEQHERHEGFDAAVRWILENVSAEDGLVGVVGERVRLRDATSQLGGAILGDRVSWILVRDEDAALAIIETLRGRDLGGVTFFPLAEAGGEVGSAPSEVLDLFDADEAARPFVYYLAHGSRIARSFNDARLAEHAAALRQVTPDGLLLEGDGAIRLFGGRTQEAEILSREQELPALHAAAEEATRRLSGIVGEDEALGARESELKDSIASREEELSDLERSKAEMGESRSSLRTELAMLREEHARLTEERSTLEAEIVTLEEEVLRLQGAVLRSEESSTEAQTAFESIRKSAEETETQKDARVREATEREMELLRVENELKELSAAQSRFESEQEERTESIREVTARLEQRGREADEAMERILEIQTLLEGLRATERAAQERLSGERDRLSEAQATISEIEFDLKTQRRTLDELVQELHAEDVERVQAQADAEQVRRRVEDSHGIDLRSWSPPREGDDGYDAQHEALTPEERMQRVRELRERMEGMGNLNFLAEEEYETHKQRLDFHQTQETDLKKAREDLLEVIRQINETAGVMFRETFEQVQANFIEVFGRLFPGGEASLRLEGEDPLEGDVEISARPRGKRLESIRLLSTGERSLTAIALLFSLYLTKPSPICLLDEVDAPLDDANLDRFLEMLKSMSERTQFIMITHNKKTMQVAENLFGVTMEEPGVSKIVSVRLKDGGFTLEADDAPASSDETDSSRDGSGSLAVAEGPSVH